MVTGLFQGDAAHIGRQPKSDRLILSRFLREAAKRPELSNGEIEAAHQILIKWADLESSGQLGRMNETQLQGEFLGDVFGKALGYVRFSDGVGRWTLEQHYTIEGQTPDAVLGEFKPHAARRPLAIIELKGPLIHLDRFRSGGRTAVQQCWWYLSHTERECRWGIVSNIASFRLYERDSTPRRYEHFTLQSLRDPAVFRQFFCLFDRRGLIEGVAGHAPRAVELLKKTNNRQREVGDELYDRYSQHRAMLIDHLIRDLKHSVNQAIEIVQRLLDRVIFIAFCEDRGLLKPDTIRRAHEELPAFYAVTNPRWQNFKNLFRFVDGGSDVLGIPAYNGGLFAESDADNLELDDKWTHFFNIVGGYDFADEVNLDVLGHLFERSITELEKLRSGGLFEAGSEKVEQYARMPQSAKRKQLGIYYTPPELTSRIVQYTVDELITERLADLALKHAPGMDRDEAIRHPPASAKFWREAIEVLRDIKIIDPACGSGAFLFQAYEILEHRYEESIGHLNNLGEKDAARHAANVAEYILNDNLYGVDLSPEAVEITQLALWIRSATWGKTLATLSRNIVHGNSLVHDPAVHPAGFDWKERFPEVFDRKQAGFDCVIGNPPWERIKLQEREFFSLPAPEIATATNAAKRRKLVAKLESDDPALYQRYQEALAAADALLTYCRRSGDYPLTGKGDINTYAVFAELASQIVAPHGRVGLLTPSGIASDNTTKDFFAAVAESNRLIRLYDFENKKVFFPEVHASFKFCILNFGGAKTKHRQADYFFFAHAMEDLEDRKRHITLSSRDIALLNPNTRTCPIFRTKRDAEITKQIYRRVPVLIDQSRERTGNPWGIDFKTMFHQTNDAELFHEAADLKKRGYKLHGNRWKKGKHEYLPLYEAKMFRPYDHRFGSAFSNPEAWFQQGHTMETTEAQHQNPEYEVIPRWWAEQSVIADRQPPASTITAFRNIARSTDTRTLLPCFIPYSGVINSAPYLTFDSEIAWRVICCFLANAYALAFDFVVRNKLGGTNLNFFIIEQLPIFSPDTYAKPCPWQRKVTLEKWISERVLKLTCTSEDMLSLAEACSFKQGSFKREYGGELHKWDPQDRAQLMAELDAAFFILYGIDREDAEYILSTFSGVTEPNLLLPGSRSTAEHILELYDEYRAAM